MKTTYFIFISLFAILLISCNAQKKIPSENIQGQTQGMKNPFDGYKFIPMPKSNLNIGSEWLSGQGPIDQGLPIQDLEQVNGLSSINFDSESKFNIDLKSKLLNIIGLDASYNSLKKYNLIIDSAVIVRVNNLNKLKWTSGTTYLYEGIKVKGFTLVANEGIIDTISIKLDKVKNSLEISPNQGYSNKNNVSLKGSGLFIAYKLLKFGSVNSLVLNDVNYNTTKVAKTTRENIKNISPLDYKINLKSLEIANDYRLTIYPERMYALKNYEDENQYKDELKKKDIWTDTDHSPYWDWVLVIEHNNHLINGKPKITKYKMGSYILDNNGNKTYNHGDFSVQLMSKIINNELVTESLTINNLFYNRHLAEYPFFLNDIPGYEHRKNSLPLTTFTDNLTAGW
ncbi:hypothetical protein [Sphingobacterium zeae]|uniref:hypothetical protein n=1 Tax=Sphingobacterium zeae TaxID=1776859 RepID=UPI00361ED5E5